MRPEVDAAGDRLRLLKALLTEPIGDGERTVAVVAEDGDGLIFVELGECARGDVAHGNERAVGNLRGLELPGFAHIEEKWRVFGGELLFELVDGDLEIHKKTVEGRQWTVKSRMRSAGRQLIARLAAG